VRITELVLAAVKSCLGTWIQVLPAYRSFARWFCLVGYLIEVLFATLWPIGFSTRAIPSLQGTLLFRSPRCWDFWHCCRMQR
jgi:hypothetical protein